VPWGALSFWKIYSGGLNNGKGIVPLGFCFRGDDENILSKKTGGRKEGEQFRPGKIGALSHKKEAGRGFSEGTRRVRAGGASP